ncbi:MAG: hypothetical protein EBR15_07210 [Gammaproteobacteria bacterium]|jgi:hypothetical protein|nr:hypothetical protein [Gammaproteobacteria bacterium]
MQEFHLYGNGFRMISILKTLIDIVRLRASPADLPGAPHLMWVTFGIHLLLQVTLATQFLPVRDTLPAEALLSSGFTLFWFWFLLRMFGRSERFVQTMSALFGVSCLLAPFSVPLAAAVMPQAGQNVQPSPLLAVIIVVGFYVVYVNARILRAALERSMTQCVLLFLAGDLLGGLIVIGLFGTGDVGAAVAPAR